MPRNLELKARVRSFKAVGQSARRIGAKSKGTLVQKDTYFGVRKGRLKLREIRRGPSELIAYDRPNTKSFRLSRYDVFPVERPRVLKHLLTEALGVKSVVEKRRTLFLYQNCRIHADRVRGLGSFLEFEVLVSRGRAQAKRLMDRLVREFSVDPADIIGGSYADLLSNRNRRSHP